MHCKDVYPPLQKWCVPLHMCASTLQVMFASTLLVVCSWGGGGGGGGGGHVALSFRTSDQCYVSLFVGHAGGHSSQYGAFLVGLTLQLLG